MLFVLNDCREPQFNLALEEYLFFNKTEEICMLWRNSSSIIVGKNQNTMAEIDYEYVRLNGITVVRRMTGGGAVFHDLGNLNYTYIVNRDGFGDYLGFTETLRRTIAENGVTAELSGRNDLTVNGKKISGNAQFQKGGRLLHHGTILLCADLSGLATALRPDEQKIKSKGIRSVRSRVANLCEFFDISSFEQQLSDNILHDENAVLYHLTPQDLEKTNRLKTEKYDTFEWTYGYSPKYTFSSKKRFSFGSVEVAAEISEGKIACINIYGDFFSGTDIAALCRCLTGISHEKKEILSVLDNIDIDEYIKGANKEELITVLI